MTVYLDLVGMLNFLVDYFLLLATNCLCGYPMGWGRAALAAGFGSVYAMLCVLPRISFLGNIVWRCVSLGVMAWIAFGANISALRRAIVFVLLSMALGGIALGIGNGGFASLVIAAAVVLVLCAVGFKNRPGAVCYVPVELAYGDKQIRLTALCDTGNTLRDPVTGRPVLVVGADVAKKLTGLTTQQLQSPVEALSQVPLPGLRLIPYSAVGQPGGLLLAMKLQKVRIGNWKGSSLVAFAPNGLSEDGAYQALTGGAA